MSQENPEKIRKSQLALSDWLQKTSISEIAKKYGVTEETVKTWHKRYGWAEERRKQGERFKRTIYKQCDEIAAQSTARYLRCSLRVSEMALAVIEEIYHSKKYKENYQIVQAWVNIIKDATSTHKAVMPDIPEHIAKEMLDELKKLSSLEQPPDEA